MAENKYFIKRAGTEEWQEVNSEQYYKAAVANGAVEQGASVPLTFEGCKFDGKIESA